MQRSYQYVLAGGLIIVGLVGAFGSFTGNLASMLAGLFDPSILTKAKT